MKGANGIEFIVLLYEEVSGVNEIGNINVSTLWNL